ncbi:hypothetical protein EYR40_006203 [Pleurotus pulmonarius]|nr:hypothetical protein EYR36_010825 [Pleurotus pulmonarius]KAF4599114.1 hypothetical protein EYR40_006203 [Pleurotus pulmonarius]
MSATQRANVNANTSANANEARALPLLATPGQIVATGYPPVPPPARKGREEGEDEVMDEHGTPPSSPRATMLLPQTPSNHNKRARRAATKAPATAPGGLDASIQADEGSPQPDTSNPTTMPAPSPNGNQAVGMAHVAPPPGLHSGTPPPESPALPPAAIAAPPLDVPAPAPASAPYVPLLPNTGPATTGPLPHDPPATSPTLPGGNAGPHLAAVNQALVTIGPAAPEAPPPTAAPRLQGVTKDDLFKNMNRVMLTQWEAIQGTKVILLPYDPGYAPDRAMSTTSKLRAAIMDILHLPSAPPLGSPAPEEPTHPLANSAPPYGFLLGPISAAEEALLTSRQIWSTETIAFFALPWDSSPGNFVGTITGLTYNPDATGIAAISQKLKNLILASIPILQFVAEHHDAILGFVDASVGLAALLNTMVIRPWDDNGNTRWNIYIDPPTHQPSHHARWRSLIMKCQIVSAYHGASVPFGGMARSGTSRTNVGEDGARPNVREQLRKPGPPQGQSGMPRTQSSGVQARDDAEGKDQAGKHDD